ncbi:hypothetical protein GGX14DRAFT_387623 [Mycena pura]|uniref:Uncharacterized protein n=1 Tax=Mycena pura TaxID=153505 RepID=A0AAD7E282_9AGAR|nr:hypothetical protein GGX14DRAFT_387623 [Mycena pura]
MIISSKAAGKRKSITSHRIDLASITTILWDVFACHGVGEDVYSEQGLHPAAQARYKTQVITSENFPYVYACVCSKTVEVLLACQIKIHCLETNASVRQHPAPTAHGDRFGGRGKNSGKKPLISAAEFESCVNDMITVITVTRTDSATSAPRGRHHTAAGSPALAPPSTRWLVAGGGIGSGWAGQEAAGGGIRGGGRRDGGGGGGAPARRSGAGGGGRDVGGTGGAWAGRAAGQAVHGRGGRRDMRRMDGAGGGRGGGQRDGGVRRAADYDKHILR